MVASGAFLDLPGRAAKTYRSDETVFKAVVVRDNAWEAKRLVASTRGRDWLNRRPASWNESAVRIDEPRKGTRRDEIQQKALRTTCTGQTFRWDTTTRNRGFGGDPLGATPRARGAFGKSASKAPPNDAAGAAARGTRRRETAVLAQETRDATTRGTLGYGHRHIAFTKRYVANDSAPNGWTSSTEVVSSGTRQGRFAETRKEKEAWKQTRLHSEQLLLVSKKAPYVSPAQQEVVKQRHIRDLKKKGEWPSAPPKVEVVEWTRHTKTRKADLVAVAELDLFHPGPEGGGYMGV
jgi:hypothetical protein